jgi:hypothetical protein
LADLDRDADGNVMNGEKVTVVGLSAGSLVVDEVLRQMMADGTAPNPNEITFVLAEDSSRQQLIKDSTYNSRLDYTYHTPPETPYHIVVVTGEYDGFADFPDRPWNLLAVANAMVGAIVVHVPVMFTDLSTVPAQDVTVTVNSQGGTTTHYLVPTATLPLVQLFPNLAPHAAALRALIDQGYSRNDPAPATGTAKTLVAASEPVTEQIPELPTESSGTATAAAEPAALGSAAHASTSTEDRATAGDTAGTAETPATDDPATADATDDPATADATDDPATAEAPAPDDSAAADTAGEGDSVAADTGASPVATGGDTASEKADEAAATEQADTTAESTNNSGSGAAGEGAEKSTTAEDSGTAGAAPTKKSWLSRTFRSSE